MADEPVFLTDGSARLLFRANVFPIERLTGIYGCCLTSPAAGGDKEVRVYLPDGDTMKQSKKVTLAETDVLEVHLEKKTGDGWGDYDTTKFPSPQLALYRRDMTPWITDSGDSLVVDYTKTGKKGWVVAAEKTPKADEKLLTNADFVKASGARKEYVLSLGKDANVRLGWLTIRRPNQVEEEVPVANGCAVVEICTAPHCAKETRNPCAK
ncbi:MAG: hypothetical protein K2X03_25080 [Bryobacteraceae bacterium]|nr:hypothetical protein [Bryobacteraceae bacterium]